MSNKETTKEIIDSYRKRQGQPWQNIALFVGTALLIILGAAFLITWLTGSSLDFGGIFASKTPTPTITFTPSPIPPTSTVTLTPTEALPSDTPEPSPSPTRSGAVIYIAEENDTFSAISERFDIDIFTLLVYNAGEERLNLDLSNPVLFVGDEVLVPAPGATVPTPTAIPYDVLPGFRVEHMVRPGESVGSIAFLLRSTVDDILEYNELEDPNAIYPGQILLVRVNLVTPAPTDEVQSTLVVTPGSISTLTPSP
ncbi:MAG: LysM peptidoglycan-binding domain-containing protein [Chloroflexi bacterium]|nr:LysM peptidoglycan-binding domain-containing protein [Chloroflexota bacterium]